MSHTSNQVEELTKRVAELEEQLSNLGDDYGALLQESNAFEVERNTLQSQLAWTPVADGLPTEPGVYEFRNVSSPYLSPIKLCQLHADGVWEDEDEETWPLAEFWRYAAIHTHYRRIELPEAK